MKTKKSSFKTIFSSHDSPNIDLISFRKIHLSEKSHWIDSISPKTPKARSGLYRLFHRSAATLLLQPSQKNVESQTRSNNVFIKNESHRFLSDEQSSFFENNNNKGSNHTNTQTSYVTKALRWKRRCLNDKLRSLSVVNLPPPPNSTSVSPKSSSSSIPSLRMFSSSSLLSSSSSSFVSVRESNYDSGAFSRTSSPEMTQKTFVESRLAISEPLMAPPLVLAATTKVPELLRNYSPLGSVSISIDAHTKLSVASLEKEFHPLRMSSKIKLPVLGTSALSSGTSITGSQISTVYLNSE